MIKTYAGIAAVIGLLSGCVSSGESAYNAAFEHEKNITEGHTDELSLDSYSLANLKPGQRPELKTDEASLWYQMDKYERRMKSRGNLIRNEELNAYIQNLTCKLVNNYCKDIRTYVVRMPYFNASMSPNGVLQVWSGLLLRVENEAQLAAVIGHEVGHYLRRHSLQRFRNVKDTTNALAFFQIALAFAGVPAVGELTTLAALGNIQSFSRDHEREADGYGLLLMSKAGYDPRESAKVWAYIVAEGKADKDAKIPSVFFASHPRSEERNAILEKLAKKIVAEPESMIGQPLAHGGTTGTTEFSKMIGPIKHQLLTDEIVLKQPERTLHLLSTLKERNGPSAELAFFEGEVYRLKTEPTDEDFQQAIKAYEEAMTLNGPLPVEAYRSLGVTHLKLKQKDQAVHWLSTYVEKAPQAKDRKMIAYMIKDIKK